MPAAMAWCTAPAALATRRRSPWRSRWRATPEIHASSARRKCSSGWRLHPNIPRFEDRGLWTGRAERKYPYLVMEWVEGLLLYDWFRAQRRSSREVLRVLAQVASALARAHAKGVVHRDVKGDNIRVTPEGRAVLLDWGRAWYSEARPLTDTVVPPGTTAYRPPEQRRFRHRFRLDYRGAVAVHPGG